MSRPSSVGVRGTTCWIPPWRRAVYGLLTTVFVCAVLGTGLEIGARVHLGPRFAAGLLPTGRPVDAIAIHDPDYGWVNKPGVKTRVVAPLFHYVIRHNSYGQRGRERSLAKAPGTKRVLLLGDSLAWGWGVDDEREFAALAERALGPKVEFINLGVPGYSTDQQLLRFENEVDNWNPDLVLLCFILNDVEGNSLDHNGTMAQRKPVFRPGANGGWELRGQPVPPPNQTATADGSERTMAPDEWLYAHSALLQSLYPPDAEARLARAGAAQVLKRLAFPRTQADLTPEQKVVLETMNQGVRALCDELVNPGAVTHHLLGRLAQQCRARAVPLIAFNIAHYHDQYLYTPGLPLPDGIEKHGEPDAAPYTTHLTRRLHEAGVELGFGVFSVDQAMLTEILAGRGLNVGDGHLNELGNRIIAERIVQELAPRLREQSTPH